MSRPILVFGAAGQLGREMLKLAEAREIEAVGLTRAEADITDAVAVARAVAAVTPRLILNAAAYTAVDRAESEPAEAGAINSEGAGIVAGAAAVANVPVIHISTDYVFDGTKTKPYVETDPIAPIGVYGKTKAEGEAKVRAAARRHVILRTAWVFGLFGNNFLKTMLRLARSCDRLRVVADQHGCPTSTVDIAEAVLAIDRAITASRTVCGTYHFAGSGATSWHGFAERIVAAQAKTTGCKPPVEAIPTADYPTLARRPANSELDSSLFSSTFGYRAQAWQTRTAETVACLLEQPEPLQ
ncbi:MAG TPA: dTDP-4-dehydrorhamnose reductase [Methylocella sp.]|jgi:dTDP-4-dehydrorhamnose reductase